MLTKMYVVEGMSCENCAVRVRAAFRELPEVIEAQVLPATSRAIVSMREALPIKSINAALHQAGRYSAVEITDSSPTNKGKTKKKPAFLKIFQHKKPCCQ